MTAQTCHDRPFSAPAERNRIPIGKVLRAWLPRSGVLLEIGSGTGQHAAYLSGLLPEWDWQPSERSAEMITLEAGLEGCSRPNVKTPIELDVTGRWPAGPYDAVYSANTAHIMHWTEVEAMFAGAGRCLTPAGLFVLYGPFSRKGRHTSPSNAEFDAGLRARDPGMGIRDLDDIDRLAHDCGLDRIAELAMPANNLTLIFHKPAAFVS